MRENQLPVSAARWEHWSQVPAMLCNFCFVKNHKIADNSATAEAREKIGAHLESLEF
jgi:hypothetical protein